MKTSGWILCGTGLYALALAALAPASLLDARLAQASAGRLRLASAEGSVWTGQGRAELRDAAGRAHWSSPLAWRLQPAALLSGRLDFSLDGGDASPASAMSLSWSRVELTGLDVRLPARALAAAVPSLSPWSISGDLQLASARLAFHRGQAEGKATLHWRSAGSALSPVSPLGDYALHFDARGEAWRARLETLEGPLQLSGEGGGRQGGPPSFHATAIPAADFRQTLAPFLRLVATERGNGRFEWQLP